MLNLVMALMAAGGSVTPGPGPSAAPSNLGVTTAGTPTKWKVTWTNGDTSAYTVVWEGAVGSVFASASQLAIVNPGVTSYLTTIETNGAEFLEEVQASDRYFWVTHRKNAQDSTPETGPVNTSTAF